MGGASGLTGEGSLTSASLTRTCWDCSASPDSSSCSCITPSAASGRPGSLPAFLCPPKGRPPHTLLPAPLLHSGACCSNGSLGQRCQPHWEPRAAESARGAAGVRGQLQQSEVGVTHAVPSWATVGRDGEIEQDQAPSEKGRVQCGGGAGERTTGARPAESSWEPGPPAGSRAGGMCRAAGTGAEAGGAGGAVAVLSFLPDGASG